MQGTADDRLACRALPIARHTTVPLAVAGPYLETGRKSTGSLQPWLRGDKRLLERGVACVSVRH